MSRLAEALHRAREAGRLALIPYLTAGDPDAQTTRDIVLMLDEEGADIIELGVPFSDPLADGITNQRAAERALAGGMTLAGTLELVSEIRSASPVPLMLFTYFNPIYAMGVESFAKSASVAGIDGVLVTDLPPEEAEDYREILLDAGIDPVFMLSPTSGPERVRLVAEKTRGFIYYVCRTGVTGAQEALPDHLREDVARLRLTTGHPVAAGFGLSRPEHLEALAGAADAAVVGSALVRLIGAAESRAAAVEAVRAFVRRLQGGSA
ncbi:MAG: tryptophan synthase subunit alpha [Acidobacteriota bacterium]